MARACNPSNWEANTGDCRNQQQNKQSGSKIRAHPQEGLSLKTLPAGAATQSPTPPAGHTVALFLSHGFPQHDATSLVLGSPGEMKCRETHGDAHSLFPRQTCGPTLQSRHLKPLRTEHLTEDGAARERSRETRPPTANGRGTHAVWCGEGG